MGLLAVPVIARLYTPPEVGIFATTLALTTVVVIVAPLRFDSALQVAPEEHIAPILGFTAITSLLAAVASIAFIDISSLGLRVGSIGAALLVIGIVFSGALTNVLSSLVLRDRQYKEIAKRSLARQVGTSGFQVGNAIWLPNAAGLLLGAQAGQLLGLGFLLRQARSRVRHNWRSLGNWAALRRYWRFPLLLAPSAMLNALGIQVPLLFVSQVFGSADAGNLAQALRVGAVPAVVVGAAFSSVIMAEISMDVRAGRRDQRARFMRASRGLLYLSSAWMFLMLVVVPPLLPSLLGDGWGDAGRYTRAIAVQAAVSLVVAPTSVVLLVYERAVTILLIDATRVGLLLAAGFLGIALKVGAIYTCALMSGTAALVYLFTWVVCLKTVSAGRPGG